jgi:hypothetical protein
VARRQVCDRPLAMLDRGVHMRWLRWSRQLGVGALLAFGFGASITAGCAVAAADTGSAADGASRSGAAQSRQSVASPHVSAGSPHSAPNFAKSRAAQGRQPASVVAGRRATPLPAGVGSTGRRAVTSVVPEPVAAITAARSSEDAQATKSPSALANPIGFLNSIARRIQVTFFNRTPTLTYDGSGNVIHDDGTITGQVVGKDPDGDALTYSVSTAAKGTVTIDGNGNFTFTPGAGFVPATGDIFTATVSDATAGQFHGLMGLLVPGNDAGIAWGPGQKYGAWEVRVKIPAGAPNYDPVLLLWPDAENWPTGGEIDFMEIWGDGSRQAVNSVLHYGSTNQQAGATKAVDATQWHTYAVSWTPTQITTYVDGTPIFTTTDASTFPPGPMHLAIQLDMLGPDISAGAQMHVAWVKEYSYDSFT